jgi:hypothetical protein
MKTIHAHLKVKRGKSVSIEIPTDEEIKRIALQMHAGGKPCLQTILGHKVYYHPREGYRRTTTEFSVFTGERGEPSAPSISHFPAEFTFGYNGPWSIVLSWQAGDDKPPTWCRYEEKLIRQDTPQML